MTEVSSKSTIWQVLKYLRDELPPCDVVVALSALIYLRWADFHEAEREAIAAFDDIEYKPVLPASMHWRSWHLLPPSELQGFFTDRLSNALERLNNSRHVSLATYLHHIRSAVEKINQLSPLSLTTLIQWLADQPFETPRDRRALLDVFDAVLDRVHDKFYGEFRTPAAVARFLVELAAPSAGDRVYDPCFGSAGLLTAVCDHVLRKDADRFIHNGTPALRIFGIERDTSAYVIGLTRLALAGIDDPHLELGTSLERIPIDNPQRDGFDMIFANPPWGMRVDQAGLDHFPVRTTDATGLFIQHALTQLRPQGRAIIIVPQGILFRSGPEQRLRRMLLEQHTVEAVISLPQGLFLPYTGLQASVLVLRRGGPTKSIRMIDAEPFFEKVKGRYPAMIRPSLIEELGELLPSLEPKEYCWDVDPATLADVNWDFTPKRRNHSGLIDILNKLRVEIKVIPLKECCHILAGRAIKSSYLVDTPESENPIPYVRIKDVQRGQANKGSSWLSNNAIASIDLKWKLRAGDVLLSKSGTIGKIGVVRNGSVGGVAANGLFVLQIKNDYLDPHFLAAYLDSSECRAWLDTMASGTTIRHLSKQILDNMLVPLPPLHIQHRVADQYIEHHADGLAYLSQLLTEGEDDPIAKWVGAALRHLNSEWYKTTFADNEMLGMLHGGCLGGAFTGVWHWARRDEAKKNPLTAWVLALKEVVDTMSHSEEVPPGPAFFSLLQQAGIGLRGAEAVITGHLPNENKARDLMHTMRERVEKAMAVLTDDIKITVSSSINALRSDDLANIDLTLMNQGSLPLRDLRVSTTPEWGLAQIGYLAEGTSRIISISGITPKGQGKFSLHLEWTGLNLDGQRVQGGREISFDLIESAGAEKDAITDLGGSPYVCGDPVRPERKDVFFGREELLEQIRRQIIQSGNVVLLEGNRRSGKSSILCHLEGPSAIPGWMGIYCSLQGAEGSRDGVGVPTAEVFREIAKSIATCLHTLGGATPLPNGTSLPPGKKTGIAAACRQGISDDAPFSDFRDYTEVALDKLAEHDLALLLMLDEFDKIQEGIDSGITSPQVPENIRFLVQTYNRLSAILTGSRRLKRLREEYWSALYGLGTRFGVTSLPIEAARRLVSEPVKGRLTYSREAIDLAISLTARQPFLLQCLCNRIFDMAAQLKTRSVTLDLVEQAGDTLVEDNSHFADLWNYAGSDRRRFILALCHVEASGPDMLSLGVIREKLADHGVEVDDEMLIADLEFLRELEVIELVGECSGGYYVLSIPLMGTWIERQKDFAAIKSRARAETEDQNG